MHHLQVRLVIIQKHVLPTISTVKSATKLATGSGQSAQEVTLLDIALTELSTQVIVKPGQSILVGGLYADSIAKTSKGLNGDGDLLNVLFGSSNDSSSKKEILILLTPTLVQ
jgi:type II secretory pathway component GspD/PulD (secretin)